MSDGKVVFDITGNLSGINSALDSATNAIAQQTAKWTVLGQAAMNALVSTAKTGFGAIKDLAKNALEYNASMQTYEVNFQTLLGSAEAAQLKMAELKEYAAKTPFAFGDLADATQTLLSFDLTAEESALALKQLGDISLGDANKLKSLTLAFGQVSSSGKLMGQDLLQMINAGFNPLKVIAEETGVAYTDLKAVMSGETTSEDFLLRMEAARREVEELGVNASQSAIMLARIGEDGAISADMVAAAMRIATSEGGLFFGAMEKSGSTFKGQLSTMQDNFSTLTGNMLSGVFDSLSVTVMPKINSWLEELNAAYEKDGFTGLKAAAGRIFGEISGMALDLGAGLLAKIYNGITGDTKTTEDIKGYLSEVFGVAGDAVAGLKDIGVSVLEWIRDNGELVGKAAEAMGIGLGVLAIKSSPLAFVIGALAIAIGLLTTDWSEFQEKYPKLVESFEDLTGLDFDTFTESVEDAKDNLSAFFDDVLSPLYRWLTDNAESMEYFLLLIAGALYAVGSKTAGFTLAVGVVGSCWDDIVDAVSDGIDAVWKFFNITLPWEWKKLCWDIKDFWNTNVCGSIDAGARALADFFGINVPSDWSLTDDIKNGWDQVTESVDDAMDSINDAINRLLDFLGIAHLAEYEEDLDTHVSASGSVHGGSGHRWFDNQLTESGMFADWGTDARQQAYEYVRLLNEYRQGNDEAMEAMEACLKAIAKDPNAHADTFKDIVDTFDPGDGTFELPVSWFEGAEQSLQSELDAMNLTTTVDASLVLDASLLDSSFVGPMPENGNTGVDHASGGIFSSATRFLNWNGMHTIGESSPEALLPLDTLWRKMGLIFDKSFSANLDALQYHVMPPLPSSAPNPIDSDALSEKLTASMKEALSGLSVEMDKRKVGRILLPGISKDMADEINNRRWTG